MHAGVHGKPAVLLIHEDLGEECLQDISAVMAGGKLRQGEERERKGMSVISDGSGRDRQAQTQKGD